MTFMESWVIYPLFLQEHAMENGEQCDLAVEMVENGG